MACVWGGQTSGQIDSGTLGIADARATWPFLVLSVVLLTVLAVLEWQAGPARKAGVPLAPSTTQGSPDL
jgi:hypothetical protein